MKLQYEPILVAMVPTALMAGILTFLVVWGAGTDWRMSVSVAAFEAAAILGLSGMARSQTNSQRYVEDNFLSAETVIRQADEPVPFEPAPFTSGRFGDEPLPSEFNVDSRGDTGTL